MKLHQLNLIAITAFLLVIPTSQEPAGWPHKVSGNGFSWRKTSFSIAEQIFSNGLYAPGLSGSWAVYDLNRQFSKFEAWIGVRDDSGRRGQSYRYSFAVDGEVKKSGSIRQGDPARRIAILLTGAGALRIELERYVMLAEPRFYSADDRSGTQVELLAPQDGATLAKRALTLAWVEEAGAVAYGIELVAVTLEEPARGDDVRIWALMVEGESSKQVDVSRFAPGEYRWSVIAFDNKRALGKFSRSRSFVLRK